MAARWGAKPVVREAREDHAGEMTQRFVDEITWYMRESKISRADLAHAMQVSPGRVSQILSGDENLTLRTLSGVLTALGASVEFTLRALEDPAELDMLD